MHKVRVLLADDHQAMLDLVTSVLAIDFDIIRAVRDGGTAVAAAAQLQPDVAVLDVGMPVLNGFEVTRRLRAVGQGITVVLLTAYSDPDMVHAALVAGASAYVLKPRLDTDLVPAIHIAMEGGRFVSPGIVCSPAAITSNRTYSPEGLGTTHPRPEIFL
jgi:DNA-binding NarL/FixJ family response regulator